MGDLPLTEEELALTHVRYAKERGRADRDALAESYLPLARAVAARFTGRGIEREDLEQVAALALLSALEQYDPERGTKFSTLAVPVMAGALRHELRDRGSLIRGGRQDRARLAQLARTEDLLAQRLGREPGLLELASEIRVTPAELADLLLRRENARTVPLYTEDDDGETRGLAERLGGSDAGFDRAEDADWLRWVNTLLTERERTLLRLRFTEGQSQRACAAAMGMTQMQVSRAEKRMLGRIRSRMEADG